MSDLINRQDVLELIDNYNSDGLGSVFFSYADGEKFKNAILALPSAQKTGKWIEFPNHMAYKCSECGRIIQTTDGRRNVSKHYPFCHCGARMECEKE